MKSATGSREHPCGEPINIVFKPTPKQSDAKITQRLSGQSVGPKAEAGPSHSEEGQRHGKALVGGGRGMCRTWRQCDYGSVGAAFGHCVRTWQTV